MKTNIEGLYKGVREIKSGSFINKDGQEIKYSNYYKLIFDQLINGIPKETELKIPKEIALNLIPNLKPYDKIVINLDIILYNNKTITVKILNVEKK